MLERDTKCEICGRALYSGCLVVPGQGENDLCGECSRAVGFAQEQRLREYVAKKHPNHVVHPLTDGADGEKRAWCDTCESILSAPIRKSDPPPRIQIPHFTKFEPPNVKSS